MKRSETSLTDNLGAQFGPYKLVKRLGVGGMAETFIAVRSGPSGFTQRVCLKLVLPFFRDNPDFIALFEREARLAAKLRHRNIVGVIDFGEFEGTSYMALELVDGLDLRNVLDSQPDSRLTPDYVTLLGLELAEALEHAHHPPPGAGVEPNEAEIQGIVHRDISPSNVLISRQGEILLTDFGVAKAMTGASRKQSAVKGKVPYMSPEQLRAEPLDGRADLFALGVVLFEALGGERPYEGAHDPATIMLILKGEHPPLASLAPDAPPGLCEVIERTIAAEPEDRPASASDLIEALADYAPSPRVRREFGQLVKRLAAEKERAKAERTPSQGSNRTVLLPDSDSGEVPSAPWPQAPEPPSSPESPVSSAPEPPPPQSFAPVQPAPPAPQPPTPAPTPIPPLGSTPASSPSDSSWQPPAGGEAGRPATDPVNLVRPPSDGSASFRAPRSNADLDTTLTTLRDDRQAAQREAEESRPRRKLWLALLGSLLGIGLAATAAVVFWPSSDGGDVRPQERAESESETAPVPTERPQSARDKAKPEPSREAVAEPAQAPKEAAQAEVPGTAAVGAEPEPKPEPPPPLPKRKAEQAREKKATAPARRTRRASPSTPKPSASKPDTQATQPARLTITVFPWGNIWINGQPWGPAPLKGESMKPGAYKVSVGKNSPAETQTVRLKAGQRRTVHFDLSD